jgi:small subunit ribosomal protein S20
MATHKSAAKRARQSVRKNKVNRERRSVIQTLIKAFEQALSSKDATAALKALRSVESAIARGVGRGTLHWKTASRKTSRLAKRVKSLKS